jgi:hypothetical protein
MSFYKVSSATDTWMTIRQRVMECADEFSLPLESGSDDHSISLSPQSVDFL